MLIVTVKQWLTTAHYEKLSCRWGTARCAVSLENMQNIAQMFDEFISKRCNSRMTFQVIA